MIRTSVRLRFLSRIRFTDSCWTWTGSIRPDGYGQFAYGHGEKRTAHRTLWELFIGAIPDRLCVLHRCDNRKCVRPTHLFLGTLIENVADMDVKGRRNTEARHHGESTPTAKLTEADVICIRLRIAKGEKQVTLAREFNIDDSVITRIVKRHIWKHV